MKLIDLWGSLSTNVDKLPQRSIYLKNLNNEKIYGIAACYNLKVNTSHYRHYWLSGFIFQGKTAGGPKMHKRNRSILMRVLSVVIAAGISISGLPVSAMAAETTAEIETETASATEAEAEEASEQQTASVQEYEESSEETAEEASSEETAEDATEETTEAGQEPGDGQNPEAGQETTEAGQEPEDNTMPSLQGENDISEEGEALAKDTAIPDGWYYVGTDTYYYIDGEPVVETVINVNGSYYGFDIYGCLIKDSLFTLWSDGAGHIYQAKSNGELYVNTWYTDDGVTWSYFGEGGEAACDEVKEINGVLYAFRGICLQIGGTFVDGDDVYLVDENGVARLRAEMNGWYWEAGYHQGDGRWQYYVDGELLCDQIARINGLLYYFDPDGYLFDYNNGQANHYYYDENGTEVHFRAHLSGVLYENEWANSNNAWYYYGENGIGAEGVLTIGGTTYAFIHGKMLTSQTYTDNTGTYSINGSGVATLMEWTEGWNYLSGKWYYYENGHAVSDEIKKIGGSYYGFNENGVMYQSQVVDIFDESTQKYVKKFRAKASGELYVNSWYQDEMGQWFYFGWDGLGPTGPYKVGGTWYFFNNGYMQKNIISLSENGLYQIDGNGVATKLNLSDGWHQISGNWYYFRNGAAVYNELIKDGSKYYIVNVNGIMIKSAGYSLCDKISGEFIGCYHAKSDGSLCVNEWHEERVSTPFDSWSEWYYFGEEGVGADGLQIVNNVPHVFSHGLLIRSGVYFDKTGIYENDSDGVAVKIDPEDYRPIGVFHDYTWSESDGSWYCFEDGEPVKNKIISWGGYYGFDSSGRMFDDEEFVLYDSETGKDVYYRAMPGGKLYSGEYYQDSDGAKYYYEYGSKGAEGPVRINGKLYLFEHARLIVNELRDYKSTLYLTNSEGIAYKIQDGWNLIDGYRHYFDGNVMYTGLQTIGNSKYYFRENGAMSTGWVKIDDKHYYFKGSGAMYTGWLSSGGKWYYLDKTTGEMLTGLQTIDDQTYYMDSSGAMATGWQKIEEKWYFFKSSGAMATGWFSSGGKWYYLDKTTGEMLTGLQTIDDQTYYLGSGAMATGWQSIEGAWYYFRSSGTMVTGWLKLGNIWYYFTSSGEMVTGELTINGKLYRFNASGACLNP